MAMLPSVTLIARQSLLDAIARDRSRVLDVFRKFDMDDSTVKLKHSIL